MIVIFEVVLTKIWFSASLISLVGIWGGSMVYRFGNHHFGVLEWNPKQSQN